MITPGDLRRLATAFPEVEEFTHHVHKQPGFKVRGKGFAGMEKGARTAVFCIDQEEAAAAIAAEPDVYEEVWRHAATTSWVGMRADLTRIGEDRVRELVEHAWRNRAPKRLVAAHDVR